MLTYVEQLKQMSNKELFEKLLDNNQQWLYFSISAALTRVEKIKAELLSRLNIKDLLHKQRESCVKAWEDSNRLLSEEGKQCLLNAPQNHDL